MNNILGIKKLELSGSTTNTSLVRFVQQNNIWTTSNFCLSVENGFTNLNGITINGSNSNIFTMNTINCNMTFSLSGTGNYIFNNNNVNLLNITNNGNIGIGITSPAYKLDVTGGSINATTIFKNNRELDTIYLNISNNQWLRNGNNIYTDTSLGISNIGIGITNPYGNLHIGSPFTVSDGSIIISRRDSNTSNRNFKIGYDSNYNFCFGDFGSNDSRTWNQQFLINSNATSNTFVINSNSFIGIGITNPAFKLDVSGSVNANSFIGNGSNITNINYNNITSNAPNLSNLNNWIINGNTIYNTNQNIAIGTTNAASYNLNVNGSINSSNLFINGINTNSIYLLETNANSNYLKIADATNLYDSWTKQVDGTIFLTNYINDSNAVIIGGNFKKSGITAKLYLYGNLYADNYTGNGANIINLDYNNIINKPAIYTIPEINNLFYNKTYLNQTYYQYVITQASNNFTTLAQYADIQKSIQTIITQGIDPTVLQQAISDLVANSNITITYENITNNPLLLTRSTSNTPNIINYSGNFIATNSYASAFYENNTNISNIYVSYNNFNSVATLYDKIIDRKRALMTNCNIYPPQNQLLTSYSNYITTSPYGNGLYILNSTSYSNLSADKSMHKLFIANKNYLYYWDTSDGKNYNNYNGDFLTGYTYRNTNLYDNAPFNDTGRIIANTSNGGTIISGMWVQMNYVNGFVINSFSIKSYYTIDPSLNYNVIYNKLPRTFYLLATNAETLDNWDIISYNSNLNNVISTSNPYYTTQPGTVNYVYNGSNLISSNLTITIQLPTVVTSYKYYRFVFTQCIGATEINISEIILYGAENKIEWANSSSNIYYTKGNVGINVIDDASIYKLNVNGSIYSSSNIIVNSNIGIGNTNPSAYLHIGDPAISGSDGTLIASKNNANFKFGYDDNYNYTFGDLYSGVWKKQFYINSNASSNSLVIDSNGNVGINTNNNNGFKLNVSGDTYISGKLINTSIGIGTTNTNGQQLNVVGNSTFSGTITQNTYSDINLTGSIYANSNITISNILNTKYLNVSNTAYISGILTAASNVGIGIGTNTSFNGTLHIESSSNIIGIWNGSSIMPDNSYISSFIGKNSMNGFYNKYVNIADNNSNNYLSWGISSISTIFCLTNNGYIGIGITNPSNILQIGDGGKLKISNGINDFTIIGTKDGIDINNTRIVINGCNNSGSNGNIEYISTNNGNHLFYNNGNAEMMRIMATGNIGIGTNNPNNYKLNVNGSIYSSSNIIVNSNIGIGNTNPSAYLHIGDPAISGSDGTIIASKNNANFKFGYDDNYNYSFGDLYSGVWKKQFYINSNASQNSLIIDSNGNVGINTSVTNGFKLNVIGTSYLSGNMGIGTINSEGKQLFVNGMTKIIGQTDIQGNLFQTNGNIIIADNGYIGIGGTYDTTYKLKITGNTNFSGDVIQSSGNTSLGNGTGANVAIGGNVDTNYKFKVYGNTYISGNLTTSNTANFNNNINLSGNLIQSGALCNILFEGYVGVGATSGNTLNSNFNVIGTSYFSSNVNIGGKITQNGTGDVLLIGNTTLNSNLIVTTGYVGIGTATIGATNSNFNVYGTSYFSGDINIGGKITQNGNADFSFTGVTSLNSNLVVSGAINNQVVITNNKTDGSGFASVRFNNNVNNSGYIGVGGSNTSNYSSNLYLQADKNIVINSGGSNSNNVNFIINQNGNVGIATTNPASKLHVNGITTLNSNLIVTTGYVGIGTGTIGATNSNFNVFGTSYFNSDVNINGKITQSGTGDVLLKGITTLNSNLVVSGAIDNQVAITNNKTDGSGFASVRFNNNVNNSGYIGIGGSNTSNYSSNLYLQADKNIVINTGGSNSNNANFIINQNGNVGIATTNPASKLHVNGITTLNSNLIITTGYVGIGTGTIGATNSNFNVFGTSYFNSDVNINGKITQSGTGDVLLIGTTTLNSNLSVSGAIDNQISITNNKTGGSGLAAIRFNNNVNNSGYIGVGGSNTSNYSSNLYLQADKNIVINTGGSNSNNANFIINSTGNVGIATTNPASKLHVNGITTLNSNLIVTTGYVGIGTGTIGATNSNFNVFGNAYISGDINIGGKISQNGTGDFTFTGVTTVNSNLTISGAINNQVVITNNKTDGSGLASIRFNNNVNNSGYIGFGGSNTSNYSSNLYLQADKNIVINTGGRNSNNVNFIIDSSGNVGIATTNPASKLHVNGITTCLLYTSPSPRDGLLSRMPSSA